MAFRNGPFTKNYLDPMGCFCFVLKSLTFVTFGSSAKPACHPTPLSRALAAKACRLAFARRHHGSSYGLASYGTKSAYASRTEESSRASAQWVHIAVWYVPGPESSSYVLTLGPMYVLYRYLDPLCLGWSPESGLVMVCCSFSLGVHVP